jgi:hypothetical protein
MNITKEKAFDILAKPVASATVAGLLTRFVTYGVNPETRLPYTLEFADKISPIISEQNKILNKVLSLRNIPPFSFMVGKRYSLAMVTGTLVFIGSLSADFVTRNIFSFITKDQVFDQMDSALVHTGAIGGATVAGHYIVNDNAVDQRGLYNIMLLSAVSEYAGHRITKMLKDKYMSEEDDNYY